VKHPEAALRRYCELLASAEVSVTSVRGADELWRRHVEDALTAAELIDPAVTRTLIDVGSGGGSPGIPLAAMLGLHATLLEATRPKAAFLRRVTAEIGLDAEVVHARSEEYARGAGRDRFDLALARALAPPRVAIELCLPLLRPGGRLILWTGHVEEAPLEQVADALAGRLVEVRRVDDDRRLVVAEKLGETPERFPRRPGMAGKRPLASLPSNP
jgi:16S rRNA (guanine527-N7)-methyltransferase